MKTLGYFKEKGGGMQHFQERAAERLFLKKSRARLQVAGQPFWGDEDSV